MTEQRLVTNISQAFWCVIAERGRADFQVARVSLDGSSPAPVCWFDRLFDGGILIPTGHGRPLTLLLTGPPESGKSTLAIELCHRARMQERHKPAISNAAGAWPAPTPDKTTAVSSLYISLESESQRLIDNAVRLGYSGLIIARSRTAKKIRAARSCPSGAASDWISICGRRRHARRNSPTRPSST